MTDRLIRITTALSDSGAGRRRGHLYQHAYELVRSRGAPGMTARLVPFTADRLLWAASMVVLDASPPGPAGITAGSAEPGRRDRGNDWCESGT